MSNTPRRAPSAAARARAAKKAEPAKTITFKGKKYKLAGEVGVWPLMQFSAAAEQGLSLGDPRGLAALHAMLHDVIHEDDWGQFQQDMLTSKTRDLDALMQLANDAVGMLQEEIAAPPESPNGKVPAGAVEEA